MGSSRRIQRANRAKRRPVQPQPPEMPASAHLAELQLSAIKATANSIVITDTGGVIIWVNPAFEFLTGYSGAEVIGLGTRILKSGENRPELYQDLWRTILSGKVWSGELINRRKDGSLYDEQMTITPLRNAAGETTNFVAIKQDITSRKQVERRLTLLSQAMENTSEFVGIGDSNFNIVYANRSLRAALGYSESELLGKSFHVVLSPNNLPQLREQIFAETAGGGWRGECLQRTKNGKDISILLSTGALKDDKGGVSGVFGVARDVTEEKEAAREILIKNALLEAEAETTIDGILAVDTTNKIILSNRRFEEIWNVPEKLVDAGDDLPLLRHVLDQIEDAREFMARVEYLYSHRDEKSKDEIRLRDGRILERYSSPLRDRNSTYLGRIWYFRDITERVKDKEHLQLWAQMLDQAAEGIFVCDADEKILLVNRAFEQLTGFSAQQAVGQTPRILKSGRQPPSFYAEMWKTLLEKGFWRGEMWNRRQDGEFFAEWLSVSAVRGRAGAPTHFIGIFSDITARKQDQERIMRLAQYDALTDLPNRVLLLDRLTQLTKQASRKNSKVALIFVDLDHFKEINDSFGHAAGDALLQEVAKRLAAGLRNQDTVARMGGDEFVVVIQDIGDVRHLAPIAQKLLALLIHPVTIADHELTVTASLGISVYPDDATDDHELIRNADAAMYQAKSSGRNMFQFYTSDMNRRALETLSLENALRRGIERQEFVLHYQPQVNIATGRLVGMEALIRWNRPGHGLVMPGNFVPIAEDRGLIIPIGSWVIEEACRQAAAWRASIGLDVPIAVNVSALQFRQRNFAEFADRIVRSHSITPACIEMELTESILMHAAESTVGLLQRLHEQGFRLSIDDFGTGYSSLSYLRRFSFDKIKIDRSFVMDESADSIISAIVSLAKSLGGKTIAEGVETPEQLERLREQGCDEAQGFLFGRPVCAADFEAMVYNGKVSLLTLPGDAARAARVGNK